MQNENDPSPESETAPTTGADGSLPVVGPDAMAELHADEIDNIVPTYGYHRMPIVALGGSAGSIPALKTFFQALPPDTRQAYVVIVHLSPEHVSTLPAILQATTAMPVSQAENGEKLEPNRVYVIPPGKHLTVIDGHFKLTPLEPERGRRVAVDLFFRSLADTHGPHATAIVLSGADGDGAGGMKRIKERGGLTVVQNPEEAEHDGMPRSALATGMVDWVLNVAEMPARILQYQESETLLRLPAEDGPQPARPTASSHDEDEQALRETLTLLRSRTSHDFIYYKRATILRRISRRMQINSITTLPGYLTFLRAHPGESGALLQDLLISVTNFFRDREAFAAVEKEIPELFKDKGPGDVVRLWTAACATGEETYSFAMLLVEHARTLAHPPTVQVFGCDLDAAAIQTARAGVYPPSIVADVSEERIVRFFTKDVRGYRVRRELREMVLFAEHDLLKDAPFSRMDLISCRNLLIYFDREAQDRAMDIFHFALRPNGRLFLGGSENVDESRGLFVPLDQKHRIYVRRSAPRVGLLVPTGTGTLLRALQLQNKEGPVVHGATFVQGLGAPFSPPPHPSGSEERAALAELHFQLLEHFAPPSVVINEQQDIVHLSEHAGRFLQMTGGPPTMKLMRMVHPMLRTDLRTAVFQAAETNEPVSVAGVPVLLDGVPKVADLRVTPAPGLAPGYLVITFGTRDHPAAAAANAPARLEAENVVHHLEREVEMLRAQLRDTVERYEGSAEEYRASNEELQAMNEELRSASEELETSREELQSINEELSTVNMELKSRVEEIGQVNGDLQNFMSATHIATVFLDRDLRVMRYTPVTVSFFNLIPSDTGRPLADLKSQVDYPELIADAQAVLRTLVPVEREVGKLDGEGWFLARLLPYRTTDDRIGGVVLTFVDITERKKAEAALLQSETQMRSFVMVSTNTVYNMSADWSEMRFLEGRQFLADTPDPSRTWLEKYILPEDRPAVLAAVREAVRHQSMFELEHRVFRPDGELGWVNSRAIPILNARNEITEWFGVASDITARKRAEEAVQTALRETERARGEAEAANRSNDQFLAILSHELRTPLTPVVMALGMLNARTDLPGKVKDALEMIDRNVRLETRFIDDILDMTRISRGKMEIVRTDMDLHEAVGRAVEVSAPDLTGKEQTLAVHLDAAEHRLSGDSARLQQVFWNLLKNASKFTPNGGKVTVRSRNEPGRIVVEVTDTGIGLEPGAAERIFKPFEQADATIAGEFGGLGLGLAIAKATVDAHGGELRVSSPGRNQGATFTVSLPTGSAA